MLEPSDDPKYVGYPLELPGAIGGGNTVNEAVAEIREVAITAIAFMLENKQSPPAPASAGKRTEQINVRVTPEERLRIESAAQRDGFRGVSDYVRSRALTEK